MATTMTEKETDYFPCELLNNHLAFERMLFFLARIEPTLTMFGPLNWSFCNIYNHIRATKALN